MHMQRRHKVFDRLPGNARCIKYRKNAKAAAITSSLIKMNTQFELPSKVLQPSVVTSALPPVELTKIVSPFSCSLEGLKQLLTGRQPKTA